jgi:two-component system phosphate regulon response regulator OmpR
MRPVADMNASKATREHLLIVDDDARIRQMLARYFEDEGYRVTTVADGVAMRQVIDTSAVDVVLLDVVLPGGKNGIELARELRAGSDVPIIMLTDRDEVTDRVVGLEVGADDYIAKPFHLREVLARVRSILRRRGFAADVVAREVDRPIEFEGWQLDLGRRRLLDPGGNEVVLTGGEFDMLVALVQHPGRVMSRDALMDLTRGRRRDSFDRTIDSQVGRLRKKIDASPDAPRLIKSVRGVGYVFIGRLGTDRA